MKKRQSKQFIVGWLLFTLHAICMIAVWVVGYACELNAQANGVWTESWWLLIVLVAHLLSYVVLLAGCILLMLAVRKKRVSELPAALPVLIRFSYFRFPLQLVLLQVAGIHAPRLPDGIQMLLYYLPFIVILLSDLLNLTLGCVLFARLKKAHAGAHEESG